MTDELFAAERDEPRRLRVSRWEVALWVVGAVLVATGLAAVIGIALALQAESSSTYTNTNATPLEIFLQIFSIIGPGMLTGGIVCLALAMFARLLDAHARARDRLAPRGSLPRSAPDSLPTAPSVAAPPVAAAAAAPVAKAPAPAPNRRAPLEPAPPSSTADYAAFMRPADDDPNSNR